MRNTNGARAAALALGAVAALVPGATGQAATTSKPVVPKVSTGKVSNVHGTSALLNGVVTPNKIETTYWFAYGPAKGKLVTQTKHAVIAAGEEKPVKVGQPVVGLAVDDWYEIYGSYVSEGKVVEIHGHEHEFTGPRSKPLRFDLPKGKENQITVGYGGSFDLTGSLTGTNAGGVSLSLEAVSYPYTGTFTALGTPVVSSRLGSFVFKVAKMTENTEFRIVTLGAHPTYSPDLVVHVSPRITLHVRSAGKTGLYRLYGTVTPAENGAPLLIQVLRPQKPTSKKEGPAPHPIGATVLKRATKTVSRFSIVLSLSGNEHYRAYVKLPNKLPLVSGVSGDVLIKSPHATSKHKRKKK